MHATIQISMIQCVTAMTQLHDQHITTSIVQSVEIELSIGPTASIFEELHDHEVSMVMNNVMHDHEEVMSTQAKR